MTFSNLLIYSIYFLYNYSVIV